MIRRSQWQRGKTATGSRAKAKPALGGAAAKHPHLGFRRVINHQCLSKLAIYHKSTYYDLIIESIIIHCYSTMNPHFVNINRKIRLKFRSSLIIKNLCYTRRNHPQVYSRKDSPRPRREFQTGRQLVARNPSCQLATPRKEVIEAAGWRPDDMLVHDRNSRRPRIRDGKYIHCGFQQNKV